LPDFGALLGGQRHAAAAASALLSLTLTLRSLALLTLLALLLTLRGLPLLCRALIALGLRRALTLALALLTRILAGGLVPVALAALLGLSFAILAFSALRLLVLCCRRLIRGRGLAGSLILLTALTLRARLRLALLVLSALHRAALRGRRSRPAAAVRAWTLRRAFLAGSRHVLS